ncbi:MAG TPA: efflux RND transporter periplasmic adaptor subunit [Bryobacteraceae bacterium]|nr:efflux RND transporter periplasmic adaptor subunit [Bryobacteraceae bacterium]
MRPYYALASLSASLVLAGCGSEPAPKAVTAHATPVRVEAVAVVETAWPSTYEATGTVRARTTATISSKLMGYAREVRARVGDRVHQGQALVVLDARDLDSNVSRAEAGREELKSAIPEADSGIASARAQLELAQVTFNRMQDLLNKRSITNQEFDESSARLKAAQAGFDMARAKRSQLDAKMAQVEQEVRAAGIQRGYSDITAPFSGIIITKSIEPGMLAVPGAPLFTIEREGTYRLEASIEESRLSLARVGKTVSVTIDGLDRTFAARVVEVVPAVDSAARTGTVKIDLPALPQLRSGLFGRALFDTGARKALTIPAASVVERGQLQSVYVAENNIAHVRLVTVGTSVKNQVEVLSGLNLGDRVIAPVPMGLRDGAFIEVRP